MRILFISYFYPPSGGVGLPGAQRVVKFVRHLQDISAYILTLKSDCYPDYIKLDFKIPLPVRDETIFRTSRYDLFQLLLKARSLLSSGNKAGFSMPASEDVSTSTSGYFAAKTSNSRAQRLKDFTYNIFYFPDNISPWILPAVRTGLKIVRREKIDVIFATGMPWSALVVGHILSKITGAPFIADFRDPWIGNPFLKSKGRWLDRQERKLESKIVKSASLVSANTEPLRDEFLHRYPHVSPDKIIVLPNGYDLSDFNVVLANQERLNKEPDKLMICHAGFLYGTRDPAPLLEAIEYLYENYDTLEKKIRFVQIGNIALNYDFTERFGVLLDKGIIEDLGQLPYEACLKNLLTSDVLVIIQPGTKTQVPSKLYDYLCLNRPILTITPLDGALGKLIKQYRFGCVFDPQDINGIAAKLHEFWQEKKTKSSLVADYPSKKNFDIRLIAAKLAEHLKQITHSRF